MGLDKAQPVARWAPAKDDMRGNCDPGDNYLASRGIFRGGAPEAIVQTCKEICAAVHDCGGFSATKADDNIGYRTQSYDKIFDGFSCGGSTAAEANRLELAEVYSANECARKAGGNPDCGPGMDKSP